MKTKNISWVLKDCMYLAMVGKIKVGECYNKSVKKWATFFIWPTAFLMANSLDEAKSYIESKWAEFLKEIEG